MESLPGFGKGQHETNAESVQKPFTPSRRRVLSMLATGSLIAGSGRAGATDSSVGQELARLGEGSGFGTYRGDTSVALLIEGEERNAQHPVEVSVQEPLSYEGVVETNPFHLMIRTPVDEEYTEGEYKILSAGIYFPAAQAPGLNYEPTEQWLEQHWEFTFNNGRVEGTLTFPNDVGLSNGIWTEEYFELAGGVYPHLVSLYPDATIEGTLASGRFSATVEGQAGWLEAYRIEVTADRSEL